MIRPPTDDATAFCETRFLRRRLVSRLWNRRDMDQAVLYALLLRGWQMAGGFVTIFLISMYFTRDFQGFYFTAVSLLGLQSLFELGLSTIAVNFASHEWTHLGFDAQGRLAGDRAALARLVGLGRWLFRWYGLAGLACSIAVGIAGIAIFSPHRSVALFWQAPWIALVILAGFSLAMSPFTALLEGCNQVVSVNRMRLIQAMLANLSLWSCIVIGGEVWALVAGAAVRALCDLALIATFFRPFFEPFFTAPANVVFEWRRQVWPLQWMLGIQAGVSYFASGLVTPIMFYYHGPPTAGQMGMTWTVLMVLQQASLVWIQPRVPTFGMLVAKRQFRELDHLFFRLTATSLVLMAGAGTALCFAVFIGRSFDLPLAERFLAPLPTCLFTLTVTVHLALACQAYYVRAYKREPFLWLNLVGDGALGIMAWLLGGQYGPTGAACGYLCITTFLIVPWQTTVWHRCRTEWR